jgi:hypothetical protein
VHTLVSAAVLLCDLARLPSGGAVADVLHRALQLTPAERSALRGAEEAQLRAARRAVDGHLRQPRPAHRLLQRVGAATTHLAPEPLRTLTDTLARTPLGTLDDLHRLVRDEVFTGAEGRDGAADAVVDAVSAACLADRLPVQTAGALWSRWESATGHLPAVLTDEPGQAVPPTTRAVQCVLDRIPTLCASEWARLDEAHWSTWSADSPWSVAMHEACAGAVRSRRVRQVAQAQLAAARALHLGDDAAGSTRPPGAVMALAGAVQAAALSDLLDAALHDRLARAWQQVRSR